MKIISLDEEMYLKWRFVSIQFVQRNPLLCPETFYELSKRKPLAGTFRILIYSVMLNDLIQGYAVLLSQATDQFYQSLHLRGRWLSWPVRAIWIILRAEITYQTDAYKRVISGCMRALTMLRATALHSSIGKNQVVITDMVKTSPIKDAEATPAMNLINDSDIRRSPISRKWHSGMMQHNPGWSDCIQI